MVKEMLEVPSASKITIGSSKNGHGLGIGDLNGDGLKDILFQSGWYEHPKENAFGQAWKLHEDWFLHAYSYDRSGPQWRRATISFMGWATTMVYWREQIEPAADGTLRWNEHLIDDSFSQPHALHMADIDGDGEDELITGKRVFAHNGKDPGGKEEAVIYYYNWDRKTNQFNRETIVKGSAGIGLQIRTGISTAMADSTSR